MRNRRSINRSPSVAAQRGMSLIEIIIVIVLIGAVLTFVGNRVIGGKDRGDYNLGKSAVQTLAGKPAVVLAPRGRGHVLLFAVNPMWRMNTQGMYPLVMNAVINWDKLR